jgi:hypothetical protein
MAYLINAMWLASLWWTVARFRRQPSFRQSILALASVRVVSPLRISLLWRTAVMSQTPVIPIGHVVGETISHGTSLFTEWERHMSSPRCRSSNRYFKLLAAFVILLASTSSVRATDTNPTGVFVKVKGTKHRSLEVTLTVAADRTVKVSRDKLPWGTHESMVIVAALAGGRCLSRVLPIEDPPFDDILLAPHQSLTKDIDLEALFPKLGYALKHFDVQLFWAYEAPEALHIAHWSGGWILLPKQK